MFLSTRVLVMSARPGRITAEFAEQYPNTTLARLAESRLRSMRLEGHF